MFLQLYLSTFVITTVFTNDFPGRLNILESYRLKRSCGRAPLLALDSQNVRSENNQKSISSRLTNRTEAPWVTNTGVLISKRHILTCAHCIAYIKLASQKYNKATISMSCVGSNRFHKCTEQPIQQIGIAEVTYSDLYKTGGGMRIKADIAILTLEKDIEISPYVYPVCLGGYAVDVNEPIVNFGYGSSSEEEVSRGINKAYFLQTFTAKRVTDKPHYRRDGVTMIVVDPAGSKTQPGDSGSGFIHTRDGVKSVHSTHQGAYDHLSEFYNTRVSAHLYWINYVTGINVKDEDMEFTGYLYPLIFKDNRVKRTSNVGASHPSRIQ